MLVNLATILDKMDEKLRPLLPPPPPTISMTEKMARFRCSVSILLNWGKDASVSHFILSKVAILDKRDEKLRPPLLLFQWWKKWRVFVVARVHHWIRGRAASISHFILSKIAIAHVRRDKTNWDIEENTREGKPWRMFWCGLQGWYYGRRANFIGQYFNWQS